MATPKTGAITAQNLNTEIARASTTATISMSDMRTRMNTTGAISFDDLRGVCSYTVTQGYFDGGKTGATYGYIAPWGVGAAGSISPATANGDHQIQASVNSYIIGCYTNSLDVSNARIVLNPMSGQYPLGGEVVAAGWRGSNISRICIANSSKTITSSTNTEMVFTHTMANNNSATTLLIKFT